MVKASHLLLAFSFLIALIVSACGSSAGDSDANRACLGGQPSCVEVSTTVYKEPTSGAGSFGTSTNALVCSARPLKNRVAPNEVVGITFTVRGGRTPYQVTSLPTAYGFGSTATFYGSYLNTLATDRVVSKNPTVTDALGRIAYCPFDITVSGTGGSGSSGSPSSSAPNLACTITATPSTVARNQAVRLRVDATGASSVIFEALEPQPQWPVTPHIVSGTAADALVNYSSAGTRTARARVRVGNSFATCSTTVTVADLALTLTASPGTSVPINGTIAVTASPINFTNAPSIVFTTDASYIGLSTSGNTVTVTNNEPSSPRTATITATATSDTGAVITRSIVLSFGGSGGTTSALACQLLGPTRVLQSVAGTYTIAVASGSTLNEPLRITDSDIDGAYQSSSTNTSLTLSWGSTGPRVPRVKAYGVNSGAPCNGGDWVQLPVQVAQPIASTTCSVTLSPSTAPLYTTVNGSTTVPTDVGIGPFKLDILQTYNSYVGVTQTSTGTLTPTMYFTRNSTYFTGGTVSVLARVTDQGAGNAASYCTGYLYLYP